jgi:hypothetical protein
VREKAQSHERWPTLCGDHGLIRYTIRLEHGVTAQVGDVFGALSEVLAGWAWTTPIAVARDFVVTLPLGWAAVRVAVGLDFVILEPDGGWGTVHRQVMIDPPALEAIAGEFSQVHGAKILTMDRFVLPDGDQALHLVVWRVPHPLRRWVIWVRGVLLHAIAIPTGGVLDPGDMIPALLAQWTWTAPPTNDVAGAWSGGLADAGDSVLRVFAEDARR